MGIATITMGRDDTTYRMFSDRQLVERIKQTVDVRESRQLQSVLYQRYENFVHKHWHALCRQLNASRAVQDIKEDFYAESYITFTNALAAVNINKIQNDKWKFLGYYGFYLSNQRKATAQKVIKKHAKEKSLEVAFSDEETGNTINLADLSEAGKVPSAEEIVIQQDDRNRFWKALDKCKKSLWSPLGNDIFNLRLQKYSIKNICSQLDISPWKYNKVLTQMRQDLDKELQKG